MEKTTMNATLQTPEELVLAYKQSLDQDEKERLFVKLMHSQFLKIRNNIPKLAFTQDEVKDAIQEVYVQTFKAVETYDQTKGVAFSTWFWYYIKEASKNYYASARLIYIPIFNKANKRQPTRAFEFVDIEEFKNQITAKQNLDAEDEVLDMGGFDAALDRVDYVDSPAGKIAKTKEKAKIWANKNSSQRNKRAAMMRRLKRLGLAGLCVLCKKEIKGLTVLGRISETCDSCKRMVKITVDKPLNL